MGRLEGFADRVWAYDFEKREECSSAGTDWTYKSLLQLIRTGSKTMHSLMDVASDFYLSDGREVYLKAGESFFEACNLIDVEINDWTPQ
jgi:hypothetical protein